MKYPPLVYITAPYRARTHWEIECNVQFATRIGHYVMIRGMSPVVPHVMYRHYIGGCITEADIMETVKEVMRRCDAVYVAGAGWAASSGVRSEISEARRLLMPIFYDTSTRHSLSALNGGIKGMVEYFSNKKTYKIRQ